MKCSYLSFFSLVVFSFRVQVFRELGAVAALVARHETVVALPHGTVHLSEKGKDLLWRERESTTTCEKGRRRKVSKRTERKGKEKTTEENTSIHPPV